jgi:hypothetical protein
MGASMRLWPLEATGRCMRPLHRTVAVQCPVPERFQILASGLLMPITDP